MKLLHIDSSITGGDSVSRELSSAVVGKLRQIHQAYAELRAGSFLN